jgi:hypothetical protein
MMKGDEKKIIRRFLFVIILTLRRWRAGKQCRWLPLFQTAGAPKNPGYFIPDTSWISGSFFLIAALFFLPRVAAAFGETA